MASPSIEHIRAAAATVSYTPLTSSMKTEGRSATQTGYPYNPGVKMELPNALAATSDSRGSSDKKEEGNTYSSAKKSLVDLRKELLGETYTNSIMQYA